MCVCNVTIQTDSTHTCTVLLATCICVVSTLLCMGNLTGWVSKARVKRCTYRKEGESRHVYYVYTIIVTIYMYIYSYTAEHEHCQGKIVTVYSHPSFFIIHKTSTVESAVCHSHHLLLRLIKWLGSSFLFRVWLNYRWFILWFHYTHLHTSNVIEMTSGNYMHVYTCNVYTPYKLRTFYVQNAHIPRTHDTYTIMYSASVTL